MPSQENGGNTPDEEKKPERITLFDIEQKRNQLIKWCLEKRGFTPF